MLFVAEKAFRCFRCESFKARAPKYIPMPRTTSGISAMNLNPSYFSNLPGSNQEVKRVGRVPAVSEEADHTTISSFLNRRE
jgi:hypothetical protein